MSEFPSASENVGATININEVKIPENFHSSTLASVAIGLSLIDLTNLSLDVLKPITNSVIEDVYKKPTEEIDLKSIIAGQLTWAIINYYTAGSRAEYNFLRAKSTPQPGDIITLSEDQYMRALHLNSEDKFIVKPGIDPSAQLTSNKKVSSPIDTMRGFVNFYHAIDDDLVKMAQEQFLLTDQMLKDLDENRRLHFIEPVRSDLEIAAVVASIGLPFPVWDKARTNMTSRLETMGMVDKEGNISLSYIQHKIEDPKVQQLAMIGIKIVHPLNTERPPSFTKAARDQLQGYAPRIRSLKIDPTSV